MYISLVSAVTLTVLQFATFFDDPEHFANPDPECPICQFHSTQVLLTFIPDYCSSPDIVIQIIDIATEDYYLNPEFSIDSIRAPPFV